jgi:methylphosphotriester-DNA--protein-cysteine methyltransferase
MEIVSSVIDQVGDLIIASPEFRLSQIGSESSIWPNCLQPRAFGQSPMGLVRLVRLRRASELLITTALPVADVAKRAGFSSTSIFSLAFSQLYGMDPSRFRRRFTA